MSLLGEIKMLYIKTADMSQFYPAACLTTHNLDEVIEFLSTTTRDNYQNGEFWTTQVPGQQSYTLSFEGLQVTTTEGGMVETATYPIIGNQISYDILVQMKRKGELIQWRIDSPSDQQNGFGYIENIGEVAPAGDFLTFSCSMVGYGKVSISSKTSAALFQSGQGKLFQNGQTFLYN